MSTLIVLGFETEDGAEKMQAEIGRLQKQKLIELEDAAIIVRDPKKGKPKLKQAVDLVEAGAWSGAFWGTLIGAIFLMPLFGLAIGAATGALSGTLSDYGINDEFIQSFKEQVKPGHSALFLLVEKVTLDKVLEELSEFSPEPKILHSSLTRAEEQKLEEEWQKISAENQAEAVEVEVV